MHNEIVKMPVDGLRPNPWNPRTMGKREMDALRSSIRRYGLVQPIVARPSGAQYEIIGGEHRWKAAASIGLTDVPCIVLSLDDAEAKLLSQALNEIAGSDDPEKRASLIADITACVGDPGLVTAVLALNVEDISRAMETLID